MVIGLNGKKNKQPKRGSANIILKIIFGKSSKQEEQSHQEKQWSFISPDPYILLEEVDKAERQPDGDIKYHSRSIMNYNHTIRPCIRVRLYDNFIKATSLNRE